MYILRILKFLMPLLVAINSEQNVQHEGSSSNGFLLDYLRSYIGQGLASRYNAPPSFHSGYDIRPNFQNGYDTEPHFQGGYQTGPHFKGGHDTGPHSEFKSNPHLKTDVTRLCDTVTCSNGTCNVIIKDEYSYPVTICDTPDANSQVPRNANAACRKNGLTTAILTGDPNAMRPLEPLPCRSCEDCPYGTICIGNTCCYGTPNCNDTLNRLFEKSFVFNGNTYTLSRDLVQNDIQASAICVAQGGYLVEVETAEENNALQNFLIDCNIEDDVLISGNDEQEEGVYRNQYSGAIQGFFDWDDNEPDMLEDENCIVLDASSDFLWMDRECDLDFDFRFVCEFPEPPEPDRKKKYYH